MLTKKQLQNRVKRAGATHTRLDERMVKLDNEMNTVEVLRDEAYAKLVQCERDLRDFTLIAKRVRSGNKSGKILIETDPYPED